MKQKSRKTTTQEVIKLIVHAGKHKHRNIYLCHYKINLCFEQQSTVYTSFIVITAGLGLGLGPFKAIFKAIYSEAFPAQPESTRTALRPEKNIAGAAEGARRSDTESPFHVSRPATDNAQLCLVPVCDRSARHLQTSAETHRMCTAGKGASESVLHVLINLTKCRYAAHKAGSRRKTLFRVKARVLEGHRNRILHSNNQQHSNKQ